MANPFSELFTSTEQQYGLPEGYLERTARVESQFNPSAKNPNSSAGGLFQFIDGTARDYNLTNRYDPVQATDAAARLARDNAAILKRTLGRDPTAGELYLAHQQGAGGAVKLLSNPDAPAEAIVGRDAARLNRGGGLTAGQLAQRWISKIDGGQPPQGGNPALAYAATRGRDPRANMPAPDATQAMGQMQMPSRQPMPDLSNTPDAGLRAMIAQQAGGMEMAGPSIGGLGGLGGIRLPAQSATVSAPGPQAAAQPDIESLVPRAATDPFALFGPGLARNQQAEAQRQGAIAKARMLVEKGLDPRQAIALAQDPQALQLYLQDRQRSESTAFEREKFELTKKNVEADNRRADDAAMSAPRKILKDLGIEPGHPEYQEQYKRLAKIGPVGASEEVEQRKRDAEGLGLSKDDPRYIPYVLSGTVPKESQQTLTATDKKEIYKSEDALPAIDNTLDTLKRARELNRKTYTGATAKVRGILGTSLPDGLVPDWMADPKRAESTREFGQIMSMEAIKSMSDTLKGATTDREMDRFTEILGDPSTPPDIRERTIDRMIGLAQRQREIADMRIKQLRGGEYFKPGDKQAAPTSGAPAAPAPPPQAGQPQPQPAEGLKPGVYEFVPGKGLIAK